MVRSHKVAFYKAEFDILVYLYSSRTSTPTLESFTSSAYLGKGALTRATIPSHYIKQQSGTPTTILVLQASRMK